VKGLKTKESTLDPLNPRILEPSLNQRTHYPDEPYLLFPIITDNSGTYGRFRLAQIIDLSRNIINILIHDEDIIGCCLTGVDRQDHEIISLVIGLESR
jgi:hypothetical protein